MVIPNTMPLSPKTTLSGSMAIGAVQATVTSAAVFPAAPFLAIITGEDNPDFSSWDVSDYEVIEVKEVSGSTLKQIDRAVEGTARAWPAGSWIMCGAVAELFRRLGVAITGATDDIEDLAGEGRTTETVKENADVLDAHKADDVSQGEVHGLRVENEKLEYYTGTEWKIASGGIPVGNVSGLSIEEGDAEITLMWTDPEDRYLDDLKIAEWQGTKIIRKEGSYPVSDDDGVLVVDNTTRNQYSTNGYKDTGLTNLVTYYYMAFPYTEDAITVDGANRISGMPGIDDTSGSPGSSMLIAGDMNAGFFGEVPASELFTASEIASACGISQGTAQFENEPWLKFALDGKILFRPRKSIRHSISWNSINTANCVYGGSEGKRVTKDGQTYIVRLMKGALTDPSLYDASDRGAKGSEWNRLMLPIHEQAIDKSWAYSAYVEDNIPIWNHNLGTGANGMYTDADLMTHNSHGNGSYSWCQETRNTDATRRVYRGGDGVSRSYTNTASSTGASNGWSPVLELSV